METDERPGDERELHWGEKVYVTSAALLFAFMFLDWFRIIAPGSHFTGNAWQTLHVFLALLILVILIAFLVASGTFNVNLVVLGERVFKSSIVATAGIAAVIVISVCIVSPPKLIDLLSGQKISTAPELGLYLSLVAAAGIAFGGNRAAHAEAVLARSEETGNAKSVGDGSTETAPSDTGDESDDKGENGPLLG